MQTTSSLIEGNAASPVRLIVFEDLQCGDCARLNHSIEQELLPAYRDRIAIEHHDFPLPKHDWARPAAMAVRHFRETNPSLAARFRADVLNNITAITASTLEPWVRAFARRHNLDEAAASSSLSNVRLAAEVDHDFQTGVDRGVKKTPTVFLGSIAFIERFPYEDLVLLIESALRREGA